MNSTHIPNDEKSGAGASLANTRLDDQRPSVLDAFEARIQNDGRRAVEIPDVKNFREFLITQAKVKTTHGYVDYSFEGREMLLRACEIIDLVLGSTTGQTLKDATLGICGGAQFGKTVLVLNLKGYLLGVRFLNVGYYLPDDDLVQGIVDTKFRPDVLDQIPWLAELIQVGKAVNNSGKAVNRKGAFMVTDGKRSAQGYMRGMGKIPTTFSMDAVIEDEKDDIPDKNAKFLPGRMTASELRFRLSIGTQRIHGAGQNREFLEGTQEVGIIDCPKCAKAICTEEEWPQVCRAAHAAGAPSPEDPQLTYEGDFKRPGENSTAAVYDPQAHYYLACTDCGTPLDRKAIHPVARFPERAKLHKFSVRISQVGTSAIELIQIVNDWCNNAVKDPECMIAFCCDRLAMPKSTSQAITPQVLERARSVAPYDLSLSVDREKLAGRFGGLDMGDRCWFISREVAAHPAGANKRITWLEQLSAEKVRSRVPALFHTLGLDCLFVDAGPLRDLSRDLCFLLNGLVNFVPPNIPDPEKAYISFPGGLIWDGSNQKWKNLKCAAVEFTLKDSQGVKHKLGITQDKKFYPLIQCNRDETIQRVVNEFLTAEEGVIEVIDGKMRTVPAMRIPQRKTGSPKIIETFESHLLIGSRKEKDKDGKLESFVDKCENHFLLADAYSGLAETAGGRPKLVKFAYQRVERRAALGKRGRGMAL